MVAKRARGALLWCSGVLAACAADGEADTTAPGQDVLVLTTGERLLGELRSIRDNTLRFDSEHFGVVSLGVGKVADLRTARPILVLDERRRKSVGRMQIRDKRVLQPELARDFPQGLLLSAVPADRNWWQRWHGDVSLGASITRGNTERVDVWTRAWAVNRTSLLRQTVEYAGNYAESLDREVSNNQRAMGKLEVFISRRSFLTPIDYEFFADRIQNIAQRHTGSVGGGYEVSIGKPECDVSAGVGYQHTRFESVPVGEARSEELVVIELSTRLKVGLHANVTWITDYRILQGFDHGDHRDHDLRSRLRFDLIGDLGLDLTGSWNRTGLPQERADGTEPERDDYGATVGFAYGF